jgi:signal transduction histidine kinase
LALSDRERALETWLEEQGVESAWETAPALASLNYDPSDLAARLAPFAAEHLSAVIDWLRATYTVYNLLAEIGHGAERISGIVKALKAYSYLDQAPVQTVDIHEGVENSLLILRHKLRQGITIQREYAPNLPKIEGYGSELNQVWTNILDNAADALGGHGHITLRTRQEGEWIVVEIEDNGPGIPPEVQPRIFDPFFTTKPPGEGSGLGLEISHNIIVHKHRGDIKVFSRPGKTCFQVWLPINFEAR